MEELGDFFDFFVRGGFGGEVAEEVGRCVGGGAEVGCAGFLRAGAREGVEGAVGGL